VKPLMLLRAAAANQFTSSLPIARPSPPSARVDDAIALSGLFETRHLAAVDPSLHHDDGYEM
jgi:hypothetical protein